MPGHGIILQTVHPFTIGNVECFRSAEEMLRYTTELDLMAVSNVPGYNICIIYGGPYKGFPVFPGTIPVIERTVSAMAQFFLDERIYYKPKAYERFKY